MISLLMVFTHFVEMHSSFVQWLLYNRQMRYNIVIGCAPVPITTQEGCYDVALVIEGMHRQNRLFHEAG